MPNALDIQHFKYPKDVDEELVSLLDAVNSVPGLRSMFCCCGHGRQEFYIMLACCNEEIAKKVFKIFNLPFQKDIILAISNSGGSRIALQSGKILSKDNKFYAYLDSPDISRYRGFATQEKISISVYSEALGMLKTRERKLEISKLEKKFLKLVPKIHWW